MDTNPTVDIINEIEEQLKSARQRVTSAKNELIEAVNEMNKLGLLLNKKRIEILQAERDKK